jgi:hypothetical protein
VRRRRRKHRRNPLGSTAKDLIWTLAVTALTAATGAVVVYYVNKKLAAATATQTAAQIGKGSLYPTHQTTSGGG